jgi:hypothetical protein
LLRERVVSAIDNVRFYAELYRPYGAPPPDLEDFIAWRSCPSSAELTSRTSPSKTG